MFSRIVPRIVSRVKRAVGIIQVVPPWRQVSAQPLEIELGKRAVRPIEIAHGTLQNRARSNKVPGGRVMKSDRQLDHTLEMQTEMPTRRTGAGPIARYRAPDVFENFMRVEKVGAVEQADTSVYLCLVERHGFNRFGRH